MRKAVNLRTLTTEEETEIRKLAASRKAAYRLVQRAKVIIAMLDDPKLHATQAGQLAGFSGRQSGVDWVKRFNAEGIAERQGVHLSDSTIWEWVETEGLRWKRQESWFHDAEKADPEFVEKYVLKLEETT